MEGHPAPIPWGTAHLKGVRLRDEIAALLMPSPVWLTGRSDPTETKMWELVLGMGGAPRPNTGLVGVPFDTTSLLRRGGAFAPQRIREILAVNRCYEPSLGVDLADKINVVDFGDVRVFQTDVGETHRRIETVFADLWGLGLPLVALGGDHGNTYPIVKGLTAARPGRMGVIMFDSHTDLRRDYQGEITSGTPFRRILEDIPGRPVSPENLVQVGIGGWHNSRTYWDFTQQQGITVVTARAVHRRGIEAVVAEALEVGGRGTERIYVSVDIDAADAAYVPGTASPTPGALTSLQLLEAMYLLGAEPRVAGLDVMEVSPPNDVNDVTSVLAAALVQNFLAGLTLRPNFHSR